MIGYITHKNHVIRIFWRVGTSAFQVGVTKDPVTGYFNKYEEFDSLDAAKAYIDGLQA